MIGVYAASFGGAAMVVGTLWSDMLTVVVPRAERPRITRYHFELIGLTSRNMGGRIKDSVRRDAFNARLARLALVTLSFVWATHNHCWVCSRLLGFFEIQHPAHPSTATCEISIDRETFDAMCGEVSAAGVPLKSDLDQTWRDSAGWRVGYDASLLGISDHLRLSPGEWFGDGKAVPTADFSINGV